MQHLTVLTSKRNSLFDSKGRFHWTMNGVGLEFNHLFGFGVLDAGAMVALATQWKSVPARYHCEAGSDKTIRYWEIIAFILKMFGILEILCCIYVCYDKSQFLGVQKHVYWYIFQLLESKKVKMFPLKSLIWLRWPQFGQKIKPKIKVSVQRKIPNICCLVVKSSGSYQVRFLGPFQPTNLSFWPWKPTVALVWTLKSTILSMSRPSSLLTPPEEAM